MRHRIRIPIQFRDLDVLGHVNSTVYIQYMETARVDLLASVAPAASWYKPPIIVVAVQCEYKAPITQAREVSVEAWVSRIGNSSWDLDYEVRPSGGEIAATGRSTQVSYDYARSETQAIPSELRDALKEHTEAPLRFR